jgi:hypothetical protein
MMTTETKSPQMAATLERLYGRTTAKTQGVCLSAPIGCGKPVGEFRDALSRKEHAISGLCQACQDKVFSDE